MQDFLAHPAVQAGIAPFVVALVAVALLHRVRLAGLALTAAFFTTVYLVAGFTFTPLSATRKIFLVALATPVVGLLADFAFKPTRLGYAVLAVAGVVAALWIFWPLLAQKPAADAWLLGGSIVLAVATLVGAGIPVAEDPVRAGAAGLALGLGAGVSAIFGASATYGSYGVALGAGCGAFLLVQMITGKKWAAGATFSMTSNLLAGLLAAGAMMLAKVPWYAVLVLALVPLAVLLPAPRKAPVWVQAVLLSLYAFAVAGAAVFLSWHTGDGTSG